MSYTPNTWQTGDIVTADKLNNMEQGIAGAGGGGNLVVRITKTVGEEQTDYATDKTAGEIKAALEAGQDVVFPYHEIGSEYEAWGIYSLAGDGVPLLYADVAYAVEIPSYVAGATESLTMTASTESDYLTASEGGK